MENASSLKYVVHGEQAATHIYIYRSSASFTVDQLRNERGLLLCSVNSDYYNFQTCFKTTSGFFFIS